MSDFFVMTESIDSKVIGPEFPQCSDFLRDYDNTLDNSKSLFSFSYYKGRRSDITPDLTAIKANARTKMTDLLSCPLGPGNDLVISSRFYELLNDFKKSEIQFFDCVVNQKDNKYNYKWVHFIFDLESYVDYSKSIFFHPDKSKRNELFKIRSYSDFKLFYEKDYTHGLVKSKKLYIEHEQLDFFLVGRFDQKCYVSERLKQKVESMNLTGIEFIKSHEIFFIPFNEGAKI